MQKIRKINIHLFKYLLLMCALLLGFAHATKPTRPVFGEVINAYKISPKGIAYSAYPITKEGDLVSVTVQFKMNNSFLEFNSNTQERAKASYLKIYAKPSLQAGNAELISEPIIIKYSDIAPKIVDSAYSDTATINFTLKGEGVFNVSFDFLMLRSLQNLELCIGILNRFEI